MAVTEGTGIKAFAPSASVGPVEEGCKIKIGFDVFFCRIWYLFSPWHRRAYPGVVSVAADDVMVRLPIALAPS